MKSVKILFVLLSFLMVDTTFGQPAQTSEEFKAAYNKKIRKSRINGTYIPKDFEDAFVELSRLSDPGDLKSFSAKAEKEAADKLLFGLGKWMIVNWSFYEGSRYSHLLKLKGVSFPDDMAHLTIRLFHRHLNGLDLNEDELIQSYVQKRKEEFDNRMSKGEVIHEEKRTREKK